MKKRIRIITCYIALVAMMAMAFSSFKLSVLADPDHNDGDVEISEDNFKDETFRNYVSTNFDTSGNGWLDPDEISAVTSIDVSGMGISDLEGINFFINLATLSCNNNDLSVIPIDETRPLTVLNCSDNHISEVDLSCFPDLQELHIEQNAFASVDISNNADLVETYTNGNFTINREYDTVTYSGEGGLLLSADYDTNIVTGGDALFFVLFETNGGSEVAAKRVCDGDKVEKPDDPTKTDVVFDGWYDDSQLTSEYDFDTAVTSNTTLYAKWVDDVAIEATVTFETNGGTEITSQKVALGETATRPDPDPVKENFEFDNWYEDPELTTLYDFATPVNQDITIYAKWNEAIPKYTVVFIDRGTQLDKRTLARGDKIEKLNPDPEWKLHAFEGWFEDEEDVSSKWDFDTEVTRDVTLYSGWSVKTVYNVVDDFGAIPNDGRSDYEAFKDALAAAKQIDETITINVPKGTYNIDKTLFIYSDTKLILDSNATIISNCTEDTTGMLLGVSKDGTNHGGYDQIQNVEIAGGKWNRNSASDKLTNVFVLRHGQNISIHDVTVGGCTDHIINVSADKDVNISNVTFNNHIAYTGTLESFWGNHRYGDPERYAFVEAIHTDFAGSDEPDLYPADNTVCDGITVTGCTFDGALAGVGTHHESSYKTKNVTVTNCTFKSLKYGAAVNAFSFVGLTMTGNAITGSDVAIVSIESSGTIERNSVTTSGAVIDKYGVFHLQKSDVTVKSNTINSASKYAIRIKDGGKVTATSNTINNTSGVGIKVESGTSEAIITGNTINNVGDYGVFAKDVAGRVSIENNIFKGNGKVGVYLENCSSSSNTVKGNSIPFGSENNIVIVSSNGVASGNTLSNSAQHAINVTNGTVTLDNNTITGAKKNGIFALGGNITVTNNNINNSGEFGIRSKDNSSITVNNNKISNTTKYSVYITNSSKAVTISGNDVSGNKEEFGISIDSCSGNNIIQRNTVKSGSNAGIAVYNCSATVNDNNVTGVTGDAFQTYGADSSHVAKVTAKNNTFITSSTSAYDVHLLKYSNCVLDMNTLGTREINAAKEATYTITGFTGIKDGIYYENGLRSTRSGLVEVDNTWYYLKNGAVDTSATTLVEYKGKYYYVQQGVLVWGVQTLVQYYGTWYYVYNSTYDTSFTGVFNYGGTEYFIQKGVLKWGINGLTHVGNNNWYYLKNSAVDKSVTTLVNYSGAWYYVKNGKLDWSFTGVTNYGGTDYYIQKGTLKWGVNGLTNCGGTWYYLNNSAVQRGYTGLVQFSGKWYYVQKGELKWGVRTLVQYGGTWYYVNNSTLDWNYTGIIGYGGTDYYVQRGVLKWGVNGLTNCGGTWYYLNNSAVKRDYTGLVQHGSSWYYVQKGELKWGVRTLVQYGGTWYYVNNSTLDWNYTGIIGYGGTDYYVQKGVLKWGVNGLTNVGGTWYYLNNSAVQKGYTGLVEYNNTLYYVQKGVLEWGYNGVVTYKGKTYTVVNSIAIK